MADNDATRRVRHDLGKYVHLEARWLGEDADADELREALRTDLLRTRRGPEGHVGCVELWAQLRPTLSGVDVAEVDRLVESLGAAIPKLESYDLRRLRSVAEEARALADACRRLGE
jgi:hypothetical protein